MGLFDDIQGAFKNATGDRPSNNNRARDIMDREYYGGRGEGTTKCRNCGTSMSFGEARADHILPRSKGGPDSSWNVQPLCAPCNRDKSDKIDGRTIDGYRKKLTNE